MGNVLVTVMCSFFVLGTPVRLAAGLPDRSLSCSCSSGLSGPCNRSPSLGGWVLTAAEPAGGHPGHPPTGLTPRQHKLQRTRLALILTILGVVGFFSFITLVTLLRMWRRHRRRAGLGRRQVPTDYLDAWSHYRLDDDGDPSAPSSPDPGDS